MLEHAFLVYLRHHSYPQAKEGKKFMGVIFLREIGYLHVCTPDRQIELQIMWQRGNQHPCQDKQGRLFRC